MKLKTELEFIVSTTWRAEREYRYFREIFTVWLFNDNLLISETFSIALTKEANTSLVTFYNVGNIKSERPNYYTKNEFFH